MINRRAKLRKQRKYLQSLHGLQNEISSLEVVDRDAIHDEQHFNTRDRKYNKNDNEPHLGSWRRQRGVRANEFI